MTELIKAVGLKKSYKMGQTTLDVLKGLDFSVSEGEFVGIVGASGSGKSTLLHILGALDKPDAGYVQYEGKNIDKFSSAKLNRFRNNTVGFIFQFYHLLDELNVLENTILPQMIANGGLKWFSVSSGVRQRAKELLERLGLGGRLRHRPYQLSGGERQRAAIARAMINNPALLLADEPTGNLDSATGHGILEVLRDFNRQGQTIVMVTHDDRIESRVSRVVRLADGMIVDQKGQQ